MSAAGAPQEAAAASSRSAPRAAPRGATRGPLRAWVVNLPERSTTAPIMRRMPGRPRKNCELTFAAGPARHPACTAAARTPNRALPCSSHASVHEAGAEHVHRAGLDQQVHHGVHLFPRHQRRDRVPAVLLQLRDRRRALARRDLAALLEAIAVAVVDDHDEPRGRHVAVYPLEHGLDDLRFPRGLRGAGDVLLLEEQGLRLEDVAHDLETRSLHGRAGLHEVHHRVGEAQAAGRLHGSGDHLDGGLRGAAGLGLELLEEASGQKREGCHDLLPDQRRRVLVQVEDLGGLQAQFALADAELPKHRHVGLLVPRVAFFEHRLLQHVASRDAKIDVPLHHVGRDVRSGQKDKLHGQLLAHGHVQPVWPLGVQPSSLQELHDILVNATLLGNGEEHDVVLHNVRGHAAAPCHVSGLGVA
mmetsp:Transcript_76863/g.166322  ORF Transcript_76863/g.166322 Transcript_76863/m.166322 type:complete len:416 (+) Transcript_76863:36-1283(+)